MAGFDGSPPRDVVQGLYEPLLLAYARCKGLSGHDADDVAQEVLARLLKALPRFDLRCERGRFHTWLAQARRHHRVRLLTGGSLRGHRGSAAPRDALVCGP